jgi:hypothetical protein
VSLIAFVAVWANHWEAYQTERVRKYQGSLRQRGVEDSKEKGMRNLVIVVCCYVIDEIGNKNVSCSFR